MFLIVKITRHLRVKLSQLII